MLSTEFASDSGGRCLQSFVTVKVKRSDPAKTFWWICSVPFSWTWHAAQADVLTASYLCALAVMRSIDASAKEGSEHASEAGEKQ